MMADGGFSVEGRENIQEILSKQLYLCQVKIQGYVNNIFLLNISLGCPYSQNLWTPCNHLSFMVSTDFETANGRYINLSTEVNMCLLFSTLQLFNILFNRRSMNLRMKAVNSVKENPMQRPKVPPIELIMATVSKIRYSS